MFKFIDFFGKKDKTGKYLQVSQVLPGTFRYFTVTITLRCINVSMNKA
jgi:hypothetical protein